MVMYMLEYASAFQQSSARATSDFLNWVVSSDEQEKKGFSIPAQLKLLRAYAAENGIRVVREFVDVETAKVAGRSGFNEMVDFLEQQDRYPLKR